MDIFTAIYFTDSSTRLGESSVQYVNLDIFMAIYFLRISLSGKNHGNKLLAKMH